MSAPEFNERTWALLEKAIIASVDESRRQRRWSMISKSLTVGVFLAVLFFSVFNGALPRFSSGPHTAVVKLEGVIDEKSPASADSVITGLRRAFDAPKAKAVVLLINSPGGSPVQAGYINDEIRRLRAKYPNKKCYAVIRDIGASGAYYAASAADEIFADKASLIGSIGAISEGFGFNRVLEKIGVDRRVFHAGENKAFLDPYSPLNDTQVERWQALLDTTHQQFIDAVKIGRGTRLKESPEVFSGLVFNGVQAVSLGLIDHLGSASSVARDVVSAETLVDYSTSGGAFGRLTQSIGAEFGQGFISALGQTVFSSAPVIH